MAGLGKKAEARSTFPACMHVQASRDALVPSASQQYPHAFLAGHDKAVLAAADCHYASAGR